MSEVAAVGHLSIGEVLAALRDEFSDITISKIRFLESQGLIDPERTPSGYRKFYPADLDRLRWILFQQKERFLPLKVIKERLDQLGPAELARELASPQSPLVAPEAVPVSPPADEAAPVHAGATARRTKSRVRTPVFAPTLPVGDRDDDTLVVSRTDPVEQLYTRDALRSATGIDADQLASLEQYGLIMPAREAGDDVHFDGDAMETAQIASGFFARGVEARHLRMYRTFAEREAALFGQVLLGYLRQRNPESRARLQEELVELAGLGRRLRTVLLREAVRATLSE